MDEIMKVLEEMRDDAGSDVDHYTDLLNEDIPIALRGAYKVTLAEASVKRDALTRAIAIIKAARGVVPILEDPAVREVVAEEDFVALNGGEGTKAIDTFRHSIHG